MHGAAMLPKARMNTGGTTANLNNFFQPTFGVNTDITWYLILMGSPLAV